MASPSAPQTEIPRWLPVVLGNLMPLVAVLFYRWSAFDVVFLYWLENAVIGLFNVLRIAFAQPELGSVGEYLHAAGLKSFHERIAKGIPKDARESWEPRPAPASLLATKLAIIPFFAAHYSLFMFVHLMFILALLGGMAGFHPMETIASSMSLSLIVALAMLLAEHGYLFYKEYWEGSGYKRTHPALQMFMPYPRIVVMHLAILFGGFLFVLFSLPRFTAFLLVGLKVAFELAQLGITRGSRGR